LAARSGGAVAGASTGCAPARTKQTGHLEHVRFAHVRIAAGQTRPACEPYQPVPRAARVPATSETVGSYHDDATHKTLVLRTDGSFTETTVDYDKTVRTIEGHWLVHQTPAGVELLVKPFFLPDGKTRVEQFSMPVEVCGSNFCFTNSELGRFER
jgi:hypothetical protein